MNSKNRDHIRNPREEILLETNFDDDEISTKAYNWNQPKFNRRNIINKSDDISLDRYSDYNLHGLSDKGIIVYLCI